MIRRRKAELKRVSEERENTVVLRNDYKVVKQDALFHVWNGGLLPGKGRMGSVRNSVWERSG